MGTPENSGSLVVSGTNTKRNAVLPDIVATNDPAGITLDGAQVMTSDNLQIDAGDPLEFYESGGIRYLRMKGGTWVLPIDTQVELQGTANTALNGIWIPVVADIFPFRTYPFLGICFGGTAATPAYGLDTTSGMIKPGTAYGIGFDAISIAKQIVAQTSDGFGSFYRIYTNGTTFTDAQCIAISNLPGGIAGEYVAADDDVHAGDGVYGRLYVRSYGPMQVGPIDGYRTALSGLLIHGGITTNQLRIYADTDGIHFEIADDGRGFSGADAFEFDNPTQFNSTLGATGLATLSGGFSSGANSSVTGTFNSTSNLSENSKRVVVPDRVTAGAGISITPNNTNGTVVVTNTGVITEADTLDTVTGRGNTTSNGIEAGSVFAASTSDTSLKTNGRYVNINFSGDSDVEVGMRAYDGDQNPHYVVYDPSTTSWYFGSPGGPFETLTLETLIANYVSSQGDIFFGGLLSGANASFQTIDLSGGSAVTFHNNNFSTLNFGSISAGGTAELTISVAGAISGDSVYVNPASGIESGLMWAGYVSAADTVAVRVHNTTGSPIDPAARSWSADVWRH